MANTRKSDPLPAEPGRAAPVRTTLMDSDRVSVPVDVRRALDWLGERSVTVLYELNEAGRICVLPATGAAMSTLKEAAAGSATGADDLRLVYSTGKFVQDRLDLSDAVLAHLGLGADAGKEDLFVLARGGLIEIWSAAFWRTQVAEATRRHRDAKDALRDAAGTIDESPPAGG